MSDFHQYYNTRKKKQSLARIHTLDEYLEIDRDLLTIKSSKSQNCRKAFATSLINSSANDRQLKSSPAKSKNKVLVDSSTSDKQVKTTSTVSKNKLRDDSLTSDKQVKSTHKVSKNKVVMEVSDQLTMNLRGCRRVDYVGEVVTKKNKENKEEGSATVAEDNVTMEREKNSQNSSNELESSDALESNEALHSSSTKSTEILAKLPQSPTRKAQQIISIKSPALLNKDQQVETGNPQQKTIKLSHQSANSCMASPLLTTDSYQDGSSFADPMSKISKDIISHAFTKTGIPFDPKKPFLIKVRPIGSEASVKRLCSPVTSNSLRRVNLSKSFVEVQSVPERDFLNLVKMGSPKSHHKITSRQENLNVSNIALEQKEEIFPVALKSRESQDFQVVRTEDNIDEGDEILGF